jgi:WD40 repeat protein
MKAVISEEQAQVTLESPLLIEGPGMIIGRYKLLELIGEGGMGLVYLAEQQEPIRRRAALKIVKLGMDTKQVIARFEAEKQMLALLDHPNIARVYDAGTTEAGRPYFVMEYVKGQSITEYCDQHKTSIEDRLKLFRQVCEGVQYAHQKGIIHRDIKPSNILISVQGDKPVPKIIDFGIAKALTQQFTEGTLFTQQGQLLGTPEYMSPEQVDMATQDIDTRSDIYSLGVLLYELLAGVMPFDKEALERGGFAEFQRVMREEDAPRPSTRLTSLGENAKRIAERRRTQVVPLARRLHRELEWIPLKAMRKERVRRYRSASELADDIQNYLNGNPLLAGPETAIYRVKKFVRRHAGSVATVVLVAAAIILGLVISSAMYFRAEKMRVQAEQAKNAEQEQRKVAEQQRTLAETKAEDLRRSMYVHSIQLADAKYKDGNIRRVHELLSACPNDLRGWEWHRLNYISDQSIMTLRGHQDEIHSIALSQDGKRIVSGSSDKTIKVWDAATGAELITIASGYENEVTCVVFSPDGKLIVSSSEYDPNIKVWDAATGAEVKKLCGHEYGASCVGFSPNGSRIVSGSDDDTAKVWDAETGNELMTLQGHESGCTSVAYSSDGNLIVSGDNEGEIRVWDALSGNKVMTLSQHWVSSVSFSPDGKYILSGGENDVKIWDLKTGAEVITLRGHTSPTMSVRFSPDGKFIASGDMDNLIKVWDIRSGKELVTLHGHEGYVWGVAFTQDGKKIISGSRDGTIKFWDFGVNRESTRIVGYRGNVSIAFNLDGKRIVSGSRWEGIVKVWDVSSGTELMTPIKRQILLMDMSVSPNGKYIAAVFPFSTIKVWDAETGTEMVTLRGNEARVLSAIFSPDGKRLASRNADKTIDAFDTETGEKVLTLRGHEDWVTDMAFSPDGKRIISGDTNGRVKVWDMESGIEVMTLSGHKKVIECVVFSPDGKRIASASYDGTAKIWDGITGSELLTLGGHKDMVHSVAFSPDGKRIISGSLDRTVRIWDAATGTELLNLHAGFGVGNIAFSPDGRTIAAATLEGSILLYESAPPAGGYEARKTSEAAWKIVDELYQKYGYYYEVIDKLSADKTLDESVLKLALQNADSRKWKDVGKLLEESWDVVSLPSKDMATYRQALEKIEKANILEPNNPNPYILITLGVAQYRVGMYEDALKTLTDTEKTRTGTDKIRTDTDEGTNPANLAFTAMALHKLGRTEEAKAALERLRTLLKDERFAQDEQAKAFLAEAEKLIEGEK